MPSRIFNVRVSPEEYEAIEKATKARGFKDKAKWARDVLGPAFLPFMPEEAQKEAIAAAAPGHSAPSTRPPDDELEARTNELLGQGKSPAVARLLAVQERERQKK